MAPRALDRPRDTRPVPRLGAVEDPHGEAPALGKDQTSVAFLSRFPRPAPQSPPVPPGPGPSVGHNSGDQPRAGPPRLPAAPSNGPFSSGPPWTPPRSFRGRTVPAPVRDPGPRPRSALRARVGSGISRRPRGRAPVTEASPAPPLGRAHGTPPLTMATNMDENQPTDQ